MLMNEKIIKGFPSNGCSHLLITKYKVIAFEFNAFYPFELIFFSCIFTLN